MSARLTRSMYLGKNEVSRTRPSRENESNGEKKGG